MTVTEKGLGRRTKVEDYPLQRRGGLGRTNYKINEKRGFVAGIKVVDETDDLIMISDDGIIIRIRVSDVGIMSRYAGGVKVMKVAPGSKIVSIARAEYDENAQVSEVETEAEEDFAEVSRESEETLTTEDSAAPSEE